MVSTYPEGILTVSNSTVWQWKQLTVPSPISGSQRQGSSCFPSVSSQSPRAPTLEASKVNRKGCHRVKKSKATPRGAPPPSAPLFRPASGFHPRPLAGKTPLSVNSG